MGPDAFSRYEILSEWGNGARVSLFRARDRLTGGTVALWVLASEERDPFEIPGHAAVARVLDRGEENGKRYVAQQIPTGMPLSEMVEKGPLPVGTALRIAGEVASVLTAFHRNGQTHGAIASDKIYLSPEGQVRVLGLGFPVLSQGYGSPEQVQKTSLLPASDIFSLGVVLYESLTSLTPFTGTDAEEVSRSVVYSPPPRMRVARPGLPEHVEQLVLRCLEKNPAERFGDADALLRELFSALEKPSSLVQNRTRTSRYWAAALLALLLSGISLLLLHGRPPGEPDGAVRDRGPYTGWERVAVMEPRYAGMDPSRHYLVQGVVDEIVSALAANTSLDVISTLSTRPYNQSTKAARQIAQELVADGLIESTLIEEEGRLRLHIRLADGRSGRYLWDHKLELEDEDIFELQDRIEGVLYVEFEPVWVRMADHLQRSSSVEAYTLFLEGKHLFSRYGAQTNRQAIQKLQQALEKDPNFAPAWAVLARAYGNVVNVEEDLRPYWLEEGEKSAQRAVDLAPMLPDGYHARGAIEFLKYVYFQTGDRERAEKDFDRALRLSPDFPDALLARAFLLSSQGVASDERSLVESSLKYYQRAITLQPNLPNPEGNYALALAFTGQKDLARARLERALEVNPDSAQLSYTLGTIAFFQGDPERALQVTQNAFLVDPLWSSLHRMSLAAFHVAAGNRDKALEQLSNLPIENAYDDFYAASALAGLGRKAEALKRLTEWRQKMQQRNEQTGFFRWWLREDPNFRKMREKGELDPFLRGHTSPVASLQRWSQRRIAALSAPHESFA